MQEKVYPASYYQQTGAAAIYGRAGGGAPCEYNPVGTFYKETEGSCAFSSRDDQPLFVTQEHQQRKAECPEQTVSMGSSIDDKSSTLIYPWMQRMNACSAGEYAGVRVSTLAVATGAQRRREPLRVMKWASCQPRMSPKPARVFAGIIGWARRRFFLGSPCWGLCAPSGLSAATSPLHAYAAARAHTHARTYRLGLHESSSNLKLLTVSHGRGPPRVPGKLIKRLKLKDKTLVG